jgi:hypothetical protein
MGGYHAIAHTVGVDVLAFGSTGSPRGRVQVWASSVSGPVCRLGGCRGLPNFGDRLHRQDEVKSSSMINRKIGLTLASMACARSRQSADYRLLLTQSGHRLLRCTCLLYPLIGGLEQFRR